MAKKYINQIQNKRSEKLQRKSEQQTSKSLIDLDLKINEAIVSNNKAVMLENERKNDPTFVKRQIKYEMFKEKAH